MSRTETPWGPWEPASPAEVAQIFNRSQVRWWIAGGYAIELAAGGPVRQHSDIDVLLLRPDQLAVQHVLTGWQWYAADPPGTLRPWQPGEELPAGVHDIWCRPGPEEPWRIQVMLDGRCEDDWVSRRDQRIRRPVASIGSVSAEGIPYLNPEIQLLYKANGRRPKDEIDFDVMLPMLSQGQLQWLDDALRLAYGPDHPWSVRLCDAARQSNRSHPHQHRAVQ
jgi:hypothetical protein